MTNDTSKLASIAAPLTNVNKQFVVEVAITATTDSEKPLATQCGIYTAT